MDYSQFDPDPTTDAYYERTKTDWVYREHGELRKFKNTLRALLGVDTVEEIVTAVRSLINLKEDHSMAESHPRPTTLIHSENLKKSSTKVDGNSQKSYPCPDCK